VGVDLERLRPLTDVANVPPVIFSARELHCFESLSVTEQAAHVLSPGRARRRSYRSRNRNLVVSDTRLFDCARGTSYASLSSARMYISPLHTAQAKWSDACVLLLMLAERTAHLPAKRDVNFIVNVAVLGLMVVSFASGWIASLLGFSEFGLHKWSSVALAVIASGHLGLHWRALASQAKRLRGHNRKLQ
jgi:hypothetical protein